MARDVMSTGTGHVACETPDANTESGAAERMGCDSQVDFPGPAPIPASYFAFTNLASGMTSTFFANE